MNKKAYIILGFILTSIVWGITILDVSAEKILAQKSDQIENFGNLPTEFNARNEFALTQGGTSGVWRYGYTANDASNTFVPYTSTNNATECGSSAEVWRFSNSGDTTPVIIRYLAPNGCIGTPPDSLHVHPGPGGERTVLRWVAPAAGTYQLTGAIQRANPSATSDIRILQNETTIFFTGNINSKFQESFNSTVTVAASDTIDFSIGFGNGSYNSDGTTLNVTMAQVVTDCIPAPTNLQVFIPAETSPADVQSINTNASLVGDAAYMNTGKVGRAFGLDGNGDYVRVEDNAAQRPTTALTAEGWFKFDSASGIISLISKPVRNSVFNSYTLYLDGGQLRGLIGNASQYTRALSSFSPQSGVWHHLAFTYDFTGGVSTLKLYANGVEVTTGVDGTANLPLFYDSNPFPLIIGGEFENNAPTFFLDGQADEISVYGRALPQSEIFDIVQQGSFGKCPPVACVQSPNNLVSWFAGEQNALDSRSNNHGALQNGATFETGRVGRGFKFDGVNDSVVVPNSSSLDITGNQLTIEAWINPAVSGGDHQIVSMADGTGLSERKFGLSVTSNLLSFEVETTSGRVENVVGSIPVGVWTHVAGIYNGSQMIWYINGNTVLSQAQSGNIVSSASNLYIGQFAVGGFSTFNGLIDEVSIYNRSLTTTEIQSIVNAGQSGKCKPTGLYSVANQVAWFSGDGDTRDFLGVNPNGTLNGNANITVGKVGQSFNFDGSGDNVEVANNTNLNPTSQMTLETWVYKTAGGDADMVGKDGETSARQYWLGAAANGRFRPHLSTTNNGLVFFDGATQYNLNTWYHVAMTYDGAALRIYVNGVLDGQIAASGSIITTNQPLRIGGGAPAGQLQNYLNGKLDEVSLYSSALSPSEIAAIYTAGSAGKLKSAVTSVNFARNTKTVSSLAPTTVQLSDASVNFAQVTTAGTTSQNNIDLASLPKLPSSAAFTGLAYDISTTAVYQNGSPNDVQVCFNVPALNNFTFTDLRILHLEGVNWIDRTANGNISPNLCTNNLTSLSPFVIVESAVPTAASAEISGKVTDSTGQGLNGVTVKLTDTRGNEIFRKTNNFGKYIFDNVAGGEFYIVSVGSKKYTFAVNSRAVVLNEAAENIDFVSVENVDFSENDVRKRP